MGAIVKEEVAYGRYLTVFNREVGTTEYRPPRHVVDTHFVNSRFLGYSLSGIL